MSADASRLPLWRAALVIARRDFGAILFSKAFLFFLLGPIFFAAISFAAGAHLFTSIHLLTRSIHSLPPTCQRVDAAHLLIASS